MIRSILLIIVSTICISLTGQISENTNRKDQSNVYNQSFIRYLKYLKNENINIPDTIYIEDDYKLTDSLMTRIRNTRLLVIKLSEVEKLVNKRKSITLYRLFPLEYKNHEFYISFVPFGVTHNPNEDGLFYSNSGSFWVIFDFYNGVFRFKKIDNNGI